MKHEVMLKLKNLRVLASELEYNLDKAGLKMTDINREQLFNHNIKNIISSVEGILRNEPAEKHSIRLRKEFPDIQRNISKIKETQAGRIHSPELESMQNIVKFLENNYEKL